MTDAETRLLDELAEHGLLRRIGYVRARMHSWGLSTGDPGHIDIRDPANLDPEHPRYVRADHPALAGYYTRIAAEALQPMEPDDPFELRRQANLEWAATAAHEPSLGSRKDSTGA
jgi:hypothetical protein